MINADRHHVSNVLYTSDSKTDLLIGHGLMAENDRAIQSGGYAIIPYVPAQ
jgi:hypothetical protein